MKVRRNYAQLVVVAVTVLAPLIANAAAAFLGSTLKRFNALPRAERKKALRESLSTWKAKALLGPNYYTAQAVIRSDVAFEALIDTLESFSGEATRAGGEIAHAAAREAIAQTALKNNPTKDRGRVFRLGASEGKERARMTREAYTRSRGVAKAGTPDYFASIRSPKRKEMTETTLYYVPDTQDPDGEGYFLLVYDPRRTLSIQRITQKVGGWQHVPSITHVQLESLVEISARGGKVQRTAPAIHRVIPMGRGHNVVVGPRASERDIFGDRKEAEKHAKDLDVKAASQLIPEVHSVVKTVTGSYRVDGPRADDEEFEADYTPSDIRRRKAQSEKDWAAYNKRKEDAPRGVKVPFEMTTAQEIVKAWSLRGPFETKDEAQRAAKNLDRLEATAGATPIAAKRTKVNRSFERANETAQATILAFYKDEIPLRVSWDGASAPAASARRRAPRISSEASSIYMEHRAKPTVVTKAAKPSQFHGIPYRTLREALAEEDFTEDEIDEIILEERKNRALVEEQARRDAERKLELEAQRAGRLPRRRTAARKEVE
jgi:hypothetical protein